MTTETQDIAIPVDDTALHGTLGVPARAVGLVVFAHGSGSSRFSPRNRHVAASLQARGLATLLVDLLTVDEERVDAIDGRYRFSIPLLAERLVAVTDAIAGQGDVSMPIGYFGASTGAAAALIAAARRPALISAVVSRGGRVDLAGTSLGAVRAPTLLVVGGDDHVVLQLNREAASELAAPHRLVVIPGATHLFEEPGALDEVARTAGDWFLAHLAPVRDAVGQPAG